jgi:hypothetical protein
MNERMTKRDTDGQAMMDCEKCKADWAGKHGKPMADCTALYCRNRLLGRVVEYEDTGWTPKEVTALGELFNYALKESKTLTEQLTLLKHIRKLAEADKDGRVVVLPCKVGDTVWRIKRTFETYPDKSEPYIEPDAFLLQDVFNIGKTVFLTREEADHELKRVKGW